jgi:hypothetical protein
LSTKFFSMVHYEFLTILKKTVNAHLNYRFIISTGWRASGPSLVLMNICSFSMLWNQWETCTQVIVASPNDVDVNWLVLFGIFLIILQSFIHTHSLLLDVVISLCDKNTSDLMYWLRMAEEIAINTVGEDAVTWQHTFITTASLHSVGYLK